MANEKIPIAIDAGLISQFVRNLRDIAIRIPNRARVGGGLNDADSLMAARIRYRKGAGGPNRTRIIDPAASRVSPDGIPVAMAVLPDMDEEYDESLAWPFWSSNVESGYFKSYAPGLEAAATRGDLYLKFQAKKGDVPEGEPRGNPRTYVYPDVPGFLWEALISGTSAGGMVWDLIRREGVSFEQIS